MLKLFFKKNYDLFAVEVVLLLYMCIWSGYGVKPLDDINEISLNISLIKDIVYICVVIVSILLPSSVALLVFLLKTSNQTNKYSFSLQYFYSSCIIFFFSLLFLLYALSLIPTLTDKKINISYEIKVMFPLAIVFFLILLGTYRLIRGVAVIKKKNLTDENVISKSEGKNHSMFYIEIGSICFAIIGLFSIYNFRSNSRTLSEQYHKMQFIYFKAERYAEASSIFSDMNESIRNINLAIQEASKVPKLESLDFSSDIIQEKYRYLSKMKDEKVKLLQKHCYQVLKVVDYSLRYETKMRLLENALLLISDGLLIKHKKNDIENMIKKIENKICNVQYYHYYSLGIKEEQNLNRLAAKPNFYEALKWLESDNINDRFQENEITSLKQKMKEDGK